MRPLEYSTLQLSTVHYIVLIISVVYIFHSSDDNSVYGAFNYNECSDSYCLAYGNCPKFSCKGSNKIILRNVTECGCCHRCVEELEENEECGLDMTGNIPDYECGPHLMCNAKNKKTPVCTKISDVVKSGCEVVRSQLENNPLQLAISQPLPECNEFGEYEARQCKNGTLCYCVDLNGKPLFGLGLYTESDDMNCHCSRQYSNLNEKLHELKMQPMERIHFMRCKSNGNFEPFQYHDNYTYCIDEETGELTDHPVDHRYFTDLPCAKNKYSYETKCLSDYNEQVEMFAELVEDGNIIVNFDLPQCDLDGTYAPVQCINNKCFCVDKNGEQIKSTSVDRTDKYFIKDQQCTCARQLDMIRNITKRDSVTEMFSRYQCDKNGNYLPIQCSTSSCYCVDKITGFMDDSRKPSRALKTEANFMKQLFCYQDYPDKSRLNSIIFNSV